MLISGHTDRGRVRRVNQDVFGTLNLYAAQVAAVCDGMGGAKSGEVASRLALDRFFAELEKDYGSLVSGEAFSADAGETVAGAIRRAGNDVFERASNDPDCEGMGTTLVAAVVCGNTALVANVGDSRCYHVSDGSILRVTRDHSLVEDMVLRGEITMEEARHHPSRNLITRALGTVADEFADVFELTLREGDFLILCSDGLSNLLTGDELLAETRNGTNIDKMCERLVETALERGAPDNVTVVIVKM
ncbi:MAG: Stp1/IreP family PP2C-type Ser/Thr phosphatase [Oscillospiraceae bacterium]|nr:Stp1/IreP family PP2C-type Ser/Thr phosphatase [Oscillospiraceae bacterium]